MKKLSLIIILLLFFSIAFAEEDFSMKDFMENEAQELPPAEAVTFLDDGVNQSQENTEKNAEAAPAVVTEADGSTVITITAVGDVTIGGDVRHRKMSIFDKELKKQGGDITFPFRNVKSIFEADDMTLVNFEGTLTTAPYNKALSDHRFLFSAPPAYVEMLPANSIEAVALENNHVMDHGQDGYDETARTLEQAGIVYSNAKKLGLFSVKGVDIAMLSYQTFNGLYPKLHEQVPRDIAAAKEKYDIVIVSYHWGEELDYWPNDRQQELGKATIDAGADLVLGHHSHRINPIEEYKGKYIVYSLGNGSFAGHSKPKDMSTFIFQLRFRVKEGEVKSDAFRIIPCRISSRTDYNDFALTPYDNPFHIESLIKTLTKNGSHLENPVQRYPLEF